MGNDPTRSNFRLSRRAQGAGWLFLAMLIILLSAGSWVIFDRAAVVVDAPLPEVGGTHATGIQ